MSIKSEEDVELVKKLASLDVNVDQKRIHSKVYHRLGKEQYEVMQKISQAHIDSFDYMIDHGLVQGLKYLRPTEVEFPNGQILRIKITRFEIGKPMIHKEAVAKTRLLYPAECRMRRISYKAPLQLSFSVTLNDRSVDEITDIVGEIPMMLKSKRCNLHGLGPKQMVSRYEDAEELGGYFVVNGNEKLLRFLIANRRNYPIAIKRSTWKDAGQLFTEYGVQIRCVRDDQIGTNMVLHYLNNGTARLRFVYMRQLVFLPIVMVLKSLCDVTDQFIYEELIKGRADDTYYQSCIVNMLRLVQNENLLNQQHVKQYIGERFRVKVNLPHWYSDVDVTDFVLKHCVCTHLDDNVDKFNLLIYMTRKLYKFVKGGCAPENPDNPMFHELYLSGHIFFTCLLERMDNFLETTGRMIKKNIDIATQGGKEYKPTVANIRRILSSGYSTMTRPLDYMISTGNLISRTGIGLMQSAGLSIVGEKINFWRFLAHFRCVHRGSAFTERRTTEARKLYPEAWGFMCPVHTPDGTPCGLLNHLADLCFITNYQPRIEGFITTLLKLGLKPREGPSYLDYSVHYTVLFDGKEIGYVEDSKAKGFVEKLRILKTTGEHNVPPVAEIGFVPKTDAPTQYPGIYIFTNPARMLRPVVNLKNDKIELIGTFEQCYMDVAITEDERHEKTTHREVKQTSFLSILASFIPYPDFNQSPRNMYACQMGKQTMGTASHTLKYRSDNKMYSIMYAQSPLVRPKSHDIYHMDDFPIGTNAVVAVISYTGYDMEDALILNKHSVERGFKFGIIAKTQKVDLKELEKGGSSELLYIFGRNPNDDRYRNTIDDDGLPIIGAKVEYDDPICSYIDLSTGLVKFEKYHSMETAFISDVKIVGNSQGKGILQEILVSFYIPRRPVVGDKFANRHGQKGVCSFLWSCENMPFTGDGLVPDVIFNPHGYPSRMTIGMMLESMAGKSASCHGLVHESTPFIFSEDNRASEYYGDMLNKAGYNYFGTEMMYSGIDGRPLRADIFIGVIYYIRLRHMVGDKYQVRSTGPIDPITHQPVKGRKRCGGIRFGEMERDSLLAHGASFLIHDRLFTQSDKTKCFGCSNCGSIISTSPVVKDSFDASMNSNSSQVWYCTSCKTSTHVSALSLPYALRYLVAELASVGIKLQFDFE